MLHFGTTGDGTQLPSHTAYPCQKRVEQKYEGWNISAEITAESAGHGQVVTILVISEATAVRNFHASALLTHRQPILRPKGGHTRRDPA
jgi:hypothetical protein